MKDLDLNTVELFGDKNLAETSTIQVAFEDNRDAWMRYKTEGEWGDWIPAGNSSHYRDNAHFAIMNGAPNFLVSPNKNA